MSKKGVWHPDTSLALDDGCEERGRGSLASKQPQEVPAAHKSTKSKLPRRRTPAVDVSAIMSAQPRRQMEANLLPSTPVGTYDTIESRTGPSFLECSSVVYHRHPGQTSSHTPAGWEFCGWKEKESLDSYRSDKTTGSHTSSGVLDRRDIHTPADGLRPAIRASTSRYSSSYGYRRRNDYEFKHLADVHEYIEQYRQMCSYTTYNTSQRKSSKGSAANEHEVYEPEDVEQDSYNLMPIGVKSWCHGDPYLREIVSRLGVRDVSREQQLLKGPKHTPPSIVKRSRNQANLVVRANGKSDSHEEISLPITGETSIGNSSQNSPKTSRPVSRSIQSNVGSLELPNIAQTSHIRPPSQRDNRNKTNSVISVSKYLQISSRNKSDLTEEGEEEEEEKDVEETDKRAEEKNLASEGSDSLHTLSNEILSQHFGGDRVPLNVAAFQVPKPATLTMQEQMMYMDSTQREKVISNKAHSLGLISRDWSKMRRLFQPQGTTAGSESEDHTEYRYTLFRRTSTQNQNFRTQTSSRIDSATGQVHYDNSTPEKSSSQPLSTQRETQQRVQSSRPKTRAEDVRKLERLKSIYEPSSTPKKNSKKKSGLSRQPSRCESRVASRPVTRISSRRQSSKPRVPGRYVSSRPSTRADNNFQRTASVRGQSKLTIDEQETSTYWNELPVKPRHSNSRPVTGKLKSTQLLSKDTGLHYGVTELQQKRRPLVYGTKFEETLLSSTSTSCKKHAVVVGTRC